MTPKTAGPKGKVCNFPLPTFKLRDLERSSSFIKIEDLAAYIDQRYELVRIE
ncbi:pyocin activator PrtN family protein [Vibrio lamellibrachiae]|uniref:pyocin activator PrtN family protein n=1 Tax=Vibrio lamellibrachiae TaxID=2910253 RepID=UPI003D0D9724